MGMGSRGVNYLEDGREWRLPDLVLCSESEEGGGPEGDGRVVC